MRIGTTPTHTFELPSNIGSAVSKIKVTYAQGYDVILEKTFDGTAVKNNILTVVLSQEETFLFKAKKDVFIQVRVLSGENVLASDIITTTAEKCLDNEVLL